MNSDDPDPNPPAREQERLWALLERAIGIAVEAHRGQKDRYGAPYILHPLRVMNRVETVPERIVAVLHDIVEDTSWTLEGLKTAGFPDDLVAALDCLTKRDGEPYAALIERAAANPLARRVKQADLEDNLDVRRFSRVTSQDTQRLDKYRSAWQRLARAA